MGREACLASAGPYLTCPHESPAHSRLGCPFCKLQLYTGRVAGASLPSSSSSILLPFFVLEIEPGVRY